MQKIYEINEHEVSINLIILHRFATRRWRYVAVSTLIALLAGGLFHLIYEKSYVTSVKLSVELQHRESSIGQKGISALQMLALGLGNSREESNIEQLSRDILNSPSYLLCLIDTPLYFSSLDRAITLEEFYNRDRSSKAEAISDTGTWIMFNEAESPGHMYRKKLSSKKIQAIEALREQLSIELPSDERGSDRLLLTVSLPDPYASFELTEIVLKKLVEHIFKRHVSKDQEHFNYITLNFQNAKEKYDSALYFQELFEKQNAHAYSPQMIFQKKKIDQDVNFKYRVYSELGLQYEQTKTMLYRKRPAITILEPVKLPNKSPSLSTVLFISIAAGILIGLLLIMIELTVYLFGYEKYLPYRKRKTLLEQTDE